MIYAKNSSNISNMKKTIISIENCIRFFTEPERSSFLTFQICIDKKHLTSKIYHLKVSGDLQTILEQQFLIGQHSITFHGSHEDPILQDDKYVFLSIHLGSQLLKHQPEKITIQIIQDHFLYEEVFENLPYISLFDTLYSQIVENTVTTTKECSLTFHLGQSNSDYHEEQFLLKIGESFDFSHYLPLYSYIGVQCSYEDVFPEIEEKFILKGQKGIYETGTYQDLNHLYVSQLPFSNKYINHYNSQNITPSTFNLVNIIDDILNYHQTHTIQYFESDHDFLKEHYKNNLTYSQSNLYSHKKLKGIIHTEQEVCHDCPYKAICLQVVPSGLSYDLLKENIAKSSHQDCRIFTLIDDEN